MKSKTSSITIDNETFQLAAQLAKIYHKSIPDTIKDLLKKEKNVTDFQITKSVKKISGILNTDYDYKTLRSMCIAEKGAFFFHFVSSLSGPGGYEGLISTV